MGGLGLKLSAELSRKKTASVEYRRQADRVTILANPYPNP